MAIIRGVDGCPAGWLAVTVALSGESHPRAEVFPETRAVFVDGAPAVVAIDIPIGLPTREPRTCDVEARRLLGPRASSVFPAPVRAVLDAGTYQEACEISAKICGKKLSKQGFMILPKIRQVDRVLRNDPSLAGRAFEVHPEVCFLQLNGGRPMPHSKKSGFGFQDRLHLIDRFFPGSARRIRGEIPRKEASDDDILDALVALWTARRIREGGALRLPSGRSESDEAGLPMRMLA